MSEQDSIQSSTLKHPTTDDREEWRTYWKAQGQPWRTEPEIGAERQKYLAARRAIIPDIKQGIYPFKDIKLSRADVEWLLTTHDNGRGPVDWDDPSQRRRSGLDLRGADLNGEDLRHLPLARLQGGLAGDDWRQATPEQRHIAAIHLEKAILTYTHLEGGVLTHAHLQGAALNETHLESADAYEAHFESSIPTSWHGAYFDASTKLLGATIANSQHIGPRLFDVHWDGVNLTGLDWTSIHMILDEDRARKRTTGRGELKPKQQRITEYEEAIRTYRQLSALLQTQGLNEDAARYAYRAQVLQKSLLWLQLTQQGITLRQRMQKLGSWLFSWFLFLLAGYGFRPVRSIIAYLVIIFGFMGLYLLNAHFVTPHLRWDEALVLSVSSFHGRGFFSQDISLGDTYARLAALEAVVGLFIEISFIATFTKRFLGS